MLERSVAPRAKGRKITVRDVMTIASMMVIAFILSLVVAAITLPFPPVYLYAAAGIDGLTGATFYLVAANRVNKHGLIFVWTTVYGLIEGILGYAFLIPYFLVVALLAELAMIGNDAYRSPMRNAIGWAIYTAGMFVGSAVPLWWAWESYRKMALNSGFTDATLDMQKAMVTTPELMAVGVVVSATCAIAGVAFGQRLLKRHFVKAGVLK